MFFTMCVTITIGPTTLHTECCPGTNSSLTESLPNFWKAIGIYLVDGGKRHNDYDSQCKVFPFLLTPGIKKKKKKSKNWKIHREHLLGHNRTTHCFGRKEIEIGGEGKRRKKANGKSSPELCS